MDPDDHRVLGPRLNLFHQQDEAPGAVFWHPRGAVLYGLLEAYIREQMRTSGYLEVRTPQLLSLNLWKRSGHLEKFVAQMYVFEDGERSLALKPMSCPAHVQLFRQRIRSHHELPLRLCEFGGCHRSEPSGALHGLLRTRAFTQDDAHVFCLPEHVDAEVAAFSTLQRRIYARLGLAACAVGFSTRPADRAGNDSLWDEAERLLRAAAERAGLSLHSQPGEGAFYGPKLEFLVRDRLGRDWQCGTLQLDTVLPERLGAEVVLADGCKARPLMIHQAVLGSMERCVALLLEEHRGALPFWLAPEQVAVAPLAAAQEGVARAVMSKFQAAGLRCVLSEPHETLSRRIVIAREQGIPVFATVGKREASSDTVTLRGRAGATMVRSVEEAIGWLKGLEASDQVA